ncbi:TetR/AcrR family transcriptional regulator [Chitinimonas arctica]|uniref:TetR/AcrR family transcriptional regulator n=1 Tax=Chitinimonas arctica TaxID=2594795 RepID=A0A516S9Q3_9NEIS|nr:TetR family transcriptional regulator [Chitinimonas arctica]QDQ24890.1 TetR/AcrR family transcriptional regulator [Chitinimonas arctica]
MNEITLDRPISASGRKLQRRGEESRRKILDATLVLIARLGLHGVTHRAIAAEAGVPLSLTTYFFSGMNDLIGQAFDHFVQVAAPDNGALRHQLSEYLDGFSAEQLLHDPAIRQQVCAHVTSLLADFVQDQTASQSVGLAVGLNFMTQYRLDPPLRAKVVSYRASLVAGITELAGRVGSAQPETDASLVLGVIHRVQFECINLPTAKPENLLQAEIGRMLALVFRLV